MIYHIFSVGKTKAPLWQQLESDYIQRLKPWAEVDLRYYKTTANLEEAIHQVTFPLMLLDETGKEYSSPEFAKALPEVDTHEIGFIIGDADGVPESIAAFVRRTFALSRLTWTHEMARVLLLEQLYRAESIQRNHPYHRV